MVIALVVIAAITLALMISLFLGGNFSINGGTSTPSPSPADYIGFPNIQFTSVNSSHKPEGGYIINLQIKNIGPATASFDPTNILLNGHLITSISDASATFSQTTLVTNASATGIITLPSTGFSSGMTVNATIQTTRYGLQFSKIIILPQ
jgi:hypothetical protein